MKAILAVSVLLLSSAFFRVPIKKQMRYHSKIVLKIPEPSDICFSSDSLSLYIVSDQGSLYQTDLKGNILRKSDVAGTDFEGVHADEEFVYIADESARRVLKLDNKTLKQVAVYDVPYSGARNSGIESLTFNQARGTFIMITEKNPILIFELDKDFRKVNLHRFTSARDISAATYHDGHLWLLSDEDRAVFKLDPYSFDVLQTIRINIINPEGIAFDRDGQMVICSDDRRTLYFFSKP
ncbi:SdiA-regulated domain-containing protein [Sphingobacterium sp. lm-10]|uniref:SdiA-regulated domain-containing protein n=1 Tax=Sphingobacterium sp. lm-10 TaxID=2944904 RepID=UPI002020CF61|nr:SdiA-regulated domain-containing protein [Sphingobacterium sp. lm-10]MCL7989328.1 SdiA-regulated domain-containing protein [Sphingobacterium sp. lm-10]